jgi:anti-anti-sigma factor
MQIKIDTKEKFSVLTFQENVLDANLIVYLNEVSLQLLSLENKNIILNLSNIGSIDVDACEPLAQLQQHFYDNSASFVLCNVSQEIETIFDNLQLLESMNITPTESEAWDIVQMEEIERELMDNF